MVCADANYAVPLGVMLRSIADTDADAATDDVARIDVTVLSMGIPAPMHALIAADAAPMTVRFVEIADLVPADLPVNGHLNLASYGRLFGMDQYPDEEGRVVYLDVDLLVGESLDPLFDLDLGDRPIAAVRTVAIPTLSVAVGTKVWAQLDRAEDPAYFNSGVLVIDTAEWRRRRVTDRCLEFLDRFGSDLAIPDQDALNAVVAGEFLARPLRWNQNHPLRDDSWPIAAAFDADDVDEARRNPAIVHYTGTDKPWWSTPADPVAAPWLEVWARSAVRDLPLPAPPAPDRMSRRSLIGRRLRRGAGAVMRRDRGAGRRGNRDE